MGFYSSDTSRELQSTQSNDIKAPGLPSARTQLANCSIIAAVNKVEIFDSALESPANAIYLLSGNPLTIPGMLARARARSKACLINIDFLDGLSRDRYAVEFLAAHHVDALSRRASRH